MTARLRFVAAFGLVALVGLTGTAGAEETPAEAPASAPEPGIQDETGDELLMQRERYFYSSYARRDPFGSLVSGKFAASNMGDLLDIGELKLVGVVWGENDEFAVVQDPRNHVHTLRVGDRVVNGKVLRITQETLTVQHYFFGETSNVTIKIEPPADGQGKGKGDQ